jgi:hypothetical protein
MAIYSKIVANASRGATAGTFDSVGNIVLRSDAQRLVGVLLEAGLATNTAAEAYSGICRLSSADLGVSNMTYSCPPYLGGGPATNLGYSASNTEFLPFNWATKGKETVTVEYSSNLPDPTGAASVVAAMVYSGGPKPTTSTDMEFMPTMNPLIGKGAVATSSSAVAAVSTAGTDATVPAWAKRIVGFKQYMIPNLFTAGEERVGYCIYRSTVPDWDPQEWPFMCGINAPLGTAVGKGVELQSVQPFAASFPMTGKNETISTTITLNVAVTTGDQVVYQANFC